jgi:general secretion pathway protein G
VKQHGFTLLELVVVIAVIGILSAAVAPAVIQRVLDQRIASTQAEAQTLYEAMAGTPSENQFGFLGDIGRLPSSLQELVTPGSLPSYATGNTRGIGMGWRGPYVNSGSSLNDYLTDAFGRGYTGVATGQIRSAGPDGIANTADDIVYPPGVPTLSGNVTVTVKTITSGKTVVDPVGYRVDLFYASNGAEAFLSDTATPFSFSNVPSGLHAVRVVKTVAPNAGTVVVQDTVVVRPGSAVAAELWF